MAIADKDRPVPLLGWLDDPRTDAGIHQIGASGWERQTYSRLARRANGTAHELRDAGIGPGDRVAVAVTDPARFLEGFFGTLSSGATVVPIAPPMALGKSYQDYIAHLLRTARVSAVVAPDELHAPLAEITARAGLDVPVLDRTDTPADNPPGVAPADLALLQFTSGSTSRPRAVMVSREAIEAQLGMISGWLGWDRDFPCASWLPLYHDMGLVGTFLTSVCIRSDFWHMTAVQFVRDPLTFVRCIGENGVCISPAPTFGYGLIARRVRSEDLAGTDFSRLCAAVIGAERVDAEVISSFARLLTPHGFKWEGLRPAYGLAEATLAVSGVEIGQRARVLEVAWDSLRMGAPVKYTDAGRIDTFDRRRSAALVSCGRPIPQTKVTVVDDSGLPLPDGYLGEIVVSSPSVALGYEGGEANAGSTRFADGSLVTGDAGLIVDEELYVIGRMADCVKVRGQAIYVEQIEDVVAEAVGVPSDTCAVVPSHGAGGDSLIAVVEGNAVDGAIDDVVAALAGICGTDLGFRVYAVARRGLPRTTSGKKRRRAMAESLLTGELNGRLLYDSSAPNT